MPREACLRIGYSGCDKSGHIPGGPIWMLHWLPKGYALTDEDRLLAVFFDTDHKWSGCGLRMPEECNDEKPEPMPRLLQVIKKAIDEHLRQHPEDVAGHLESKNWKSVSSPHGQD